MDRLHKCYIMQHSLLNFVLLLVRNRGQQQQFAFQSSGPRRSFTPVLPTFHLLYRRPIFWLILTFVVHRKRDRDYCCSRNADRVTACLRQRGTGNPSSAPLVGRLSRSVSLETAHGCCCCCCCRCRVDAAHFAFWDGRFDQV